MRRFGPGTAGRKVRSANRSVMSLLVVWFTMAALVVYQMPALGGVAQAVPMPMPASAAVLDIEIPCNDMGQAVDTTKASASAVPHSATSCWDPSSLDSGEIIDHSCPLMGGCFSMCASITPRFASFRVAERLMEHLGFIDDIGAPHSVPPLQRPPKYL